MISRDAHDCVGDSHPQRQSPSRSSSGSFSGSSSDPLEPSGVEGNAQCALAGTEEGSRGAEEDPEEDPEEDLEGDCLCV